MKLALDLGTLTGFAIGEAGSVLASGVVNLKGGRYEGGGMRFLRFRQWLDKTHTPATPITSVGFEEVRRHLGVDAAHVYGGLMATLTAWCESHAIPYQGVPVGTIKSFIAGRGGASKRDVMMAVADKIGRQPEDDNEADAIALLLLLFHNDKSMNFLA